MVLEYVNLFMHSVNLGYSNMAGTRFSLMLIVYMPNLYDIPLRNKVEHPFFSGFGGFFLVNGSLKVFKIIFR